MFVDWLEQVQRQIADSYDLLINVCHLNLGVKRNVLNINNFGRFLRNLKTILLVFVRFMSISSLCTLQVFHTFTDCGTCWP